MIFDCEMKIHKEIQKWRGNIKSFRKCNNCYEIFIDSRSTLRVIFGETSFGGFACIPDFEAGCHLINLSNKFWNTEKLISSIGNVDGITIGQALYELNKSNTLSSNCVI